MYTIVYGTTKRVYDVMRKKRNSLKLTVTPEMDIIVTCPAHVSMGDIESFLKRKWRWLDKQLAFFEKNQKKVYKKEYVSGESFYYLGRQYQLIIKKSDVDSVSLARDQLIVCSTQGSVNRVYTKHLVEMWYKQEAKDIFSERFDLQLKRFGYNKNIFLRIAEMKRKWGSFRGSTVTLHPLLIQAKKEAIDYVITHELCHVRYLNHNKKFWELMDEMYPRWEKMKEELEMRFG